MYKPGYALTLLGSVLMEIKKCLPEIKLCMQLFPHNLKSLENQINIPFIKIFSNFSDVNMHTVQADMYKQTFVY